MKQTPTRLRKRITQLSNSIQKHSTLTNKHQIEFGYILTESTISKNEQISKPTSSFNEPTQHTQKCQQHLQHQRTNTLNPHIATTIQKASLLNQNKQQVTNNLQHK